MRIPNPIAERAYKHDDELPPILSRIRKPTVSYSNEELDAYLRGASDNTKSYAVTCKDERRAGYIDGLFVGGAMAAICFAAALVGYAYLTSL